MAAVAIAVAVGTVVTAGLSYLMRPNIPKQRLGEISPQTAREGEPRLIVWGIVRPIGGNLITPRKLTRRIRRSNPPDIRGIYAVGVCEGPITRFRRIWRNEKLVYDDRQTTWGRRNNSTFLQDFRLYTGDWDQMPDTRLQQTFGVDAIPAFRGTAYMVAGLRYSGEDLSDTNGAVPQWRFEVERAEGVVVTSTVYPVEDVQPSESAFASIKEAPFAEPLDMSESGGSAVVGGVFRAALIEEDYLEIDATESGGWSVTGGSMSTLITQEYDGLDSSESQVTGPVGGVFRQALLPYTSPADQTEIKSMAITGGSHE